MKTLPFAWNAHALLAGLALTAPATADTAGHDHSSHGRLAALSGPAAVIAAGKSLNDSSADLDDWSGSFDVHLGIYASE